ncbi:MAG: hypothetical protein ACRDPH_16030 [Marmoricola sp.]
MRTPRLPGLVAALVALLWAVTSSFGATALAAAPSSAHGSFCSGHGVSVAVDFHQLGGGVRQACVPRGAGKSAWDVIEKAGFDLTEVSSYPGAVCEVAGKPHTSCAKMPPATAYWGLYVGKKGAWGFATKGATQLKMHDGDFIALSWNHGKKPVKPGVAPVDRPGANHAQASGRKAGNLANDAHGSSTFPWWVVVLVVVVLLAGAGAVLGRRRSTPRS